MNEFELIQRFFQTPGKSVRHSVLGNGDDCALVAPRPGMVFAVTTDTLVEGRHFFPTLSPRKLGERALAVNLSDLAAMGAQPRYAFLSLTLPALDETWLAEFSAGFFALANRYEIEVAGGNTTRGPLAVGVTALGEVPPGEALTRSGARVGDDVWVSGELGDAGYALYSAWEKTKLAARTDQIARYAVPTARIELGLALRGFATSAIDISDGLLSEAGHLGRASGVSMEIQLQRIPTGLGDALQVDAKLAQFCLLATGDAYELLFTAPASHRHQISELLMKLDLPGARIGRVALKNSDAPTVMLFDAEGRRVEFTASGWDHFAPEAAP